MNKISSLYYVVCSFDSAAHGGCHVFADEVKKWCVFAANIYISLPVPSTWKSACLMYAGFFGPTRNSFPTSGTVGKFPDKCDKAFSLRELYATDIVFPLSHLQFPIFWLSLGKLLVALLWQFYYESLKPLLRKCIAEWRRKDALSWSEAISGEIASKQLIS